MDGWRSGMKRGHPRHHGVCICQPIVSEERYAVWARIVRLSWSPCDISRLWHRRLVQTFGLFYILPLYRSRSTRVLI